MSSPSATVHGCATHTLTRRAAIELAAGSLAAGSMAITALLSGCSDASSSDAGGELEGGKPRIRISMYNSSSFPEWRAYVEQQCPDVSIDWENNRNVCSNVVYEAAHADMPDIVCIRKFESDSARLLEPYLADLSGLDLTGTFNPDVLVPFEDDGKQYWLPEPGTIEGLFANSSLFELNDISAPTDLESFRDACRTLEDNGVVPFVADCTAGYTCIALIEGFGAAGYLGTDEGRAFRESFENGTATEVDDAGMSSILDTLRSLTDDGILTARSIDDPSSTISADFLNGHIAVSKLTTDSMLSSDSTYDFIALPYFGADEEDSRLFCYPVFNIALSQTAMQDSVRHDPCIKVLEAMMDADAQGLLNHNTSGLISFTEGVSLELQPCLETVRQLIEDKRYHIRSLNSNAFATATAAMASLIDGVEDQAIIDAVNATLFVEKEPVAIGDSKVEASTSLDENLCSPAGSVLAQTVLKHAGTKFVIIDSREAASPLYKGTYTDVDIAALVIDGSIYVGNLTGQEVKQLLESCILYTTTFGPAETEPYIDYPALAGMTVTMEKDGTIDEIETAEGVPLDGDDTYPVAISARIFKALATNASDLAADFQEQDATLLGCLDDEFASGSGLPEAGDYFVVR